MPGKGEEREKVKVSFPFISIGIRILIFITLVGGTAMALRPLQVNLLERMEQSRDDFFSRVEEYWGRRIQYGSMGPSIFGVLDIRDVRVLRDDDSVLLSVSRLRLSYSIAGLIQGNTFDSFNSARIDRPVLNLDFEKDADLLERFASHNGGYDSGELADRLTFQELFPENFSLRIWNGEWDVSGTMGSFEISGVELDASVRRSRLSFQGSWNARAGLNGQTGFEAAMSARISGEYRRDRDEGSATLFIPSFSGDRFRLNPITIGFSFSDSILKASKAHDRSPTAISLVYDLESGRLLGNFAGENFPLSDMLVFTGAWAERNPLLTLMISGTASIEKEIDASFAYAVNFSGFFPGTSPAVQTSLAFRAWGDGNHATIDTLEIHSSDGTLNFNGGIDLDAIAPYGFLSMVNFGYRGGHGVNGDFSISSREREINVFGENLSAGNASLSIFDAFFFREEEGFSFALFAENAREGTLSIEGSVDNNPRQLRAALSLDSFPMGDIFSFVEPLVPLPELPAPARFAANDTYMTTEVFFTTFYGHILYNAPRVALSYRFGYREILARASLSGTERRFDLSAGQIYWQTGSAGLLASADFSNPDDIFFSLSATHNDLTYFFEGEISDRRNINVRGLYGFLLDVSGAEDGTYSGFARGENIPFLSGDSFAFLSFLFSIDFASRSSWWVDIDNFEITGLATPASSSASLRLSGAANQNGLTIPGISFNDGRGALEGDITIDWNDLDSYYVFRADIHGNNRSEHYILTGTFRDGRLALDFSGRGMQLSRVSSQNAIAYGSASLSWESVQSFEVEAELSSFVLRRMDEVITASFSASMNPTIFTLRDMAVSYSGLHASVPSFTINRSASWAQTAGVLRGSLHQRPVDFVFRGAATFSYTETWFDLLRDLDFLDGSLTFATARYDTIAAPEPFSFVFASQRQEEGFSLNLTGGPRNMLRFRYTPGVETGTFLAALSAPSPVRGSISGSISATTIDANTPDLYVDMSSLWRFIPPDTPVAFPNGIVTASVRIAGPLSDPGFYGVARGTGLYIIVPDFIPEPIRPAPVTVSLTGSEMTFGPVGAAAGRGGGQASAWFIFERWIPNIFNIDIRVPPETPIPYGFDISGLLANGLASGRLNLAMEDLIFSVSGELTAHNTEISLDSNELGADNFTIDYSRGGAVLVDLSIRTGRRVEFFWPSVSFPILQATADMGSGIRVTSDSFTGGFTLTGDVHLRSGELFYLERNFYIREGTLFFNENETDFDPRITARAEMRDIAEVGPVIISMIIDNAPLMSFTPRFESTPPLSPIEIFSLLGHNPQDGEAQRNLAASAAIDTFAQFALMRRVQRRARDFLGLDMLSIRTQAIQNFAMVAAGAQPRDETDLDRPYRVGNYFDNTTVFMGRYFGGAVFGHAMLSVRYDENRIGMGGVILEPEIGFEMRNPLFDIRFNMFPLHPENWFIDDVSVSLLWRRSF